MDDKNVILGLSNFSVKFGNKRVLEKINLEISKGEFVAVLGKSGSGKTTLLNAIAGFIKSSGKIVKSGKIGMIFQNYAVFPWLTVLGNVSFGSNPKAAGQYVKRVGLSKKSGKYPFELSGGEVQRVALARTFASNPDIVLMDEPYGALDAHTREQMQKWLLYIWEKDKKTIMIVTHSIDEAIFLSDRVLIMKEGQIKNQLKIKFKRPRKYEIKFDEKFGRLKKKISKLLV